MSVFRRRRRDENGDEAEVLDESVGTGEDQDGAEAGSEPDLVAASIPTRPAGRENGPWDVSEVVNPAARGRVNLGGMWLPGRPGLEVRIEADQATSQVVAVTLVLGDSALQLQPFAAPRTESIWGEVRTEIRAGITKQGGTADEVEGPLGTELRTRVQVRAQDGTSDVQPARFVGVDGPRWFLRGVVTGRAAVEDGADAELVSIFKDVVVVRGGAAMAPRDPIPLTLPAAPAPAGEADEADGVDGADGAAASEEAGSEEAGSEGAGEAGDQPTRGRHARSSDDLNPFERGPEITEIR